MPRAGHIYLCCDVHYLHNARIIEAVDAWPLHLAAMLEAKALLSDGRLTRRQLARIAPDIVGDVTKATDRLIELGLFQAEGDDAVRINDWHVWNDPAVDIEARAEDGKRGNHVRWHEKENVYNPTCAYCQAQSGGDIATQSGGQSQTQTHTQTKRQTQTQTHAADIGDDCQVGVVTSAPGSDDSSLGYELGLVAERLAACCTGDNRAVVASEARDVVRWAAHALDWRTIDEEVGRLEAGSNRPTLPRYIERALLARSARASVTLMKFQPKASGKRKGRSSDDAFEEVY